MAAHCISPSSCDNTTSLNDINLQLHASSTVSNPYSFNITKDMVFGATCLAENTITITVGYTTKKDINNNKIADYFYGYNSININNLPIFGTCSPSTYHGVKIDGIYIQYAIEDTLQGPNTNAVILYITFSKHVDINSIIIDNRTYNITEYPFDVGTLGCMYILDIQSIDDIQNYFINNVGKQITITLE